MVTQATADGTMSAADGKATTRGYRLVQVSDTHLSRTRGHFNDNFEVFRRAIAADPPDLIVNTGDLSLNGAGGIDDLAFANACHQRLAAPWLAIPGNHDIGEAPPFSRLGQPVDAERIARWETIVGPRWWSRVVGDGWLLVGLDSALMGSALDDEERQHAFLARALAAHPGPRKLVMLHMPPFERAAEDAAFTTMSVPFPARGRFLATCAEAGVRAIACGHLHVYNHVVHRGMDIVWAPTTAFVNIAQRLSQGLRFPRAGYVAWTLAGDAATHRLVEPADMITQDVGRWNADVGSTITLPTISPRRG